MPIEIDNFELLNQVSLDRSDYSWSVSMLNETYVELNWSRDEPKKPRLIDHFREQTRVMLSNERAHILMLNIGAGAFCGGIVASVGWGAILSLPIDMPTKQQIFYTLIFLGAGAGAVAALCA